MKYHLWCYYFCYKELQQLGDAIGTESRGLSDALIERLPKSTYKAGGIFSRKEKHEEYVLNNPMLRYYQFSIYISRYCTPVLTAYKIITGLTICQLYSC